MFLNIYSKKNSKIFLKIFQYDLQQTSAPHLKQDPEEVCEDALRAGARGPGGVAQVVEHVGDPAGEGGHDDEEGDEEHQHVLQHDADAEDDGAEVLGHDARLDALEDGQGEGDAPEDPPRRLHRVQGPLGPVVRKGVNEISRNIIIQRIRLYAPFSLKCLLQAPGPISKVETKNKHAEGRRHLL